MSIRRARRNTLDGCVGFANRNGSAAPRGDKVPGSWQAQYVVKEHSSWQSQNLVKFRQAWNVIYHGKCKIFYFGRHEAF